MTTLATMKARIADELARDDLASQIGLAISDAIRAYQSDRFLFSETRSFTFSTVEGKEFYTVSDVPAFGLMRTVDQITLTIAPTVWTLTQRPSYQLEGLTPANGQPDDYSIFARQLRFYPVPDAAYSMRLIGSFAVAEPADDTEAGNVWMNEAERLIRSRAKLEIMAHVIKDYEAAQAMQGAVADAYSDLKREYNLLTGSGSFVPTQF